MKLICPNCDAQYLVDDGLIPDAGRDVQCSNCGSTWFQPSAADVAQAAAEREGGDLQARPVDAVEDDGWDDVPMPDLSVTEPMAPQSPEPQVPQAPVSDAPDPALGAEEEGDEEDEPEGLSEALAERPRRAVDDAVLEVLREEAEREKAARAAAAQPARATVQSTVQSTVHPATQPAARPGSGQGTVLAAGLADQAPAPTAPRPQRRAEPQEQADSTPQSPAPEPAPAPAPEPEVPSTDPTPPAESTPEAAEAAPVAEVLPEVGASRRDRLPDIEEINSTLRASADPTRAGDPEQANPELEVLSKRRSSFRVGFGSVMFLAALALITYIHAPRISAQVPALKAPLQAYVGAVDRGRVWLDQSVSGITKGDEGEG